MSNNLEIFTGACAAFVTSSVLTPIVKFLNEKGTVVTVEELAAVLQLPASRAGFNQSIPSMGFGGTIPSMTPSIAPSSRRSANSSAVSAVPVGESCAYVYKRGDQKGKNCSKAKAPGSDYCASCIKSRKNLPKEISSGNTPNVPGVAPGAFPMSDQQTSAEGQLNVVAYDESRKLYLEPTRQFILHAVSDGSIVVIGRLCDKTSKIVPLTAEEIKVAEQLGISQGAEEAVNNEQGEMQQIPSALESSNEKVNTNGFPLIPSIN